MRLLDKSQIKWLDELNPAVTRVLNGLHPS
jgi:hypothetical protein